MEKIFQMQTDAAGIYPLLFDILSLLVWNTEATMETEQPYHNSKESRSQCIGPRMLLVAGEN